MATTVNLTLPRSWEELSQEQLRFLLQTMVDVQQSNRNIGFRSADEYAAQSAAQIATICLLKWNSLKVICPYGNGWLVSHDDNAPGTLDGDTHSVFKITSGQMAAAISHLSWAKELPASPVRLDIVDGAHAVDADLSDGFTFDNWLACEALWQAYQVATDETLLRQMAEILYRKEGLNPSPAETLGIFYWWAALKGMVSDMFPNFFKPSAEAAEPPSADGIRRSMDAQIRALTKGDITKENEILAMPAIRALTELDAQAREYDELNRKYNKQ